MDTLGCIHAWLIWEEGEEQLEVPQVQISAIPSLAILILLLAPLTDLHPVIAAQLLTRGSRGQEVVALQNELKQAGCFPGGVRSTGYYGKLTQAAVKKLQRTQGLRVDGIVGRQTRSALNSGKTCKSLASSGVLKMGSRGEGVRQLQAQLGREGFPVKEDGIFGRETRAAVMRFQEDRSLKPDGIVGSKTTKVLWTSASQAFQANTNQAFYDKNTYEKVFMEAVQEGHGVTKENFEKFKSAILNESIDKKTRYIAAVFLAREVYENNILRNYEKNIRKECKDDSCIDKPEDYQVNSIRFEDNKTDFPVPINSIVLILNDAINQKNDLISRSMAASAMAYIRQPATENIINILNEDIEKYKTLPKKSPNTTELSE